MSGEKSQRIGTWSERYAANYLRLRGYTVKERNYRAGHHEIDIVATRFGVIAFVEVKARSYHPAETETAPPPGTAIRSEKRRFTRQAARQYLYEHPTKKKPRMDVIEIWLDGNSQGSKPRVLKVRHMIGAY